MQALEAAGIYMNRLYVYTVYVCIQDVFILRDLSSFAYRNHV